MPDDVEVSDAPEADRYEALVDGQLAGFAAYWLAPGHITFTHTEVEAAYGGRGIGNRLAAAALDARARGLRVTPLRPSIAAHIRRHPEYADLVATDPCPG